MAGVTTITSTDDHHGLFLEIGESVIVLSPTLKAASDAVEDLRAKGYFPHLYAVCALPEEAFPEAWVEHTLDELVLAAYVLITPSCADADGVFHRVVDRITAALERYGMSSKIRTHHARIPPVAIRRGVMTLV